MLTQIKPLGSHLHILALRLKGTLPKEEMVVVLKGVVKIAGMDTAGMEPAIWTYPLPGGGGGLGNTICQPLIESFVVSDDWPELKHTYVVLASCRQYIVQAIISYLASAVGPIMDIKIVDM